MKRHVALVGFMASGKSTVGKRLARRLGWTFVDSDAEIVRERGAIERIFSREGEPAFRRYEQAVVERALAEAAPSVIAVGGGAPTHEPTRRLLADRAYRVFLCASPEQILARVRRSKTLRPLLGANPDAERVRSLYETRLPLYREAESIVDCTDLSLGLTAQVVEERLRAAGVVP
ncbi:MAG TPA: shikimate kinase [Candidatus Tyrphobacter sp.]